MSNSNPPADDAFVDDNPTGSPLQQNLKSGATWRRALFMLISCVLVSVASFVGSLVVVLGFFWVLFSGEVNRQLQQVGMSLASYIYGIICYLTFNTDEKPFPLGGQWPSSGSDDSD